MVLQYINLVCTDFPIEILDALKMFIRPSERRSGASYHMGDLVEFNRPIEQGGGRGTIHGVSENRPFIS